MRNVTSHNIDYVSVTIGAVITNCTEISQPCKLDDDTIERFVIIEHIEALKRTVCISMFNYFYSQTNPPT